MLYYKTILFCFTSALVLNSCASSAQIGGIKVIEENQDKKYTLIKTNIFKGKATILKDTTNVFNRFGTQDAFKQYILSFADVQEYESVLKNSFVANYEIVNSSDENSKGVLNYFRSFKRQYSGYINSLGDTLLVVCFIDFTRKKRAKEFFSDWKYQQKYLGSTLYLDAKIPGRIYCFVFNKRTKKLRRYK